MGKSKKVTIRQGDVLLVPAPLPAQTVPVEGVTIALGEATGHHHRIGPLCRSASIVRAEDGARYLRVGGAAPSAVARAAKEARDRCVAAAEVGAPIADLLVTVEEAHRSVEREGGAVLWHSTDGRAIAEHLPVVVPPGTYRLPVQVEYDPFLSRRVVD